MGDLLIEKKLTHITNDRICMVDISDKKEIVRKAIASGEILLKHDTIERIKSGQIEKGCVLSTARIAGIMAVKKIYELIPLCHQISISNIDIQFEIKKKSIKAKTEVKSIGKTGVEMEALTGTSIALLTIWDMVKSIEKCETGNYPDTKIFNIKVDEKLKEI